MFHMSRLVGLVMVGVRSEILTERGQAKPTRQNVVRLAPPLVITDEQLHTAIQIITEAINDLARGSPKTRVLGIGARDD